VPGGDIKTPYMLHKGTSPAAGTSPEGERLSCDDYELRIAWSHSREPRGGSREIRRNLASVAAGALFPIVVVAFAPGLAGCNGRKNNAGSVQETSNHEGFSQANRGERSDSFEVVSPSPGSKPVKGVSMESKLRDCSSIDEAQAILAAECPAGDLAQETAKQFIRFFETQEHDVLERIDQMGPGDIKTRAVASVARGIHDRHGLAAAMRWLDLRDYKEEKEQAVFHLIFAKYPRGEFTAKQLEDAFSGHQSERLEMEIELRLAEETRANKSK
jgi:hypothetical protein